VGKKAGLDWPVRLLVTQDDSGQVWAVYTDFKWGSPRATAFATATSSSLRPQA
jgi:uncharacterized protein (DUF302 family)